jgi:hypothetical protein
MLDIVRIFETIAFGIDWVSGATSGSDLSPLIFELKIIAVLLSFAAFIVAAYSAWQAYLVRSRRKLTVPIMDVWGGMTMEKRLTKWDGVTRRMASRNASDWNMAILEADSLFDEITKRIGYRGDSLGERLKNIEPSDFDSLQDVWEAHKVRNRIAHEGADYKIARDEAERVIKLFEKGLKELQYLS